MTEVAGGLESWVCGPPPLWVIDPDGARRRALGPMPEEMTRLYEHAIAAAGDLAAVQFLARQSMTPREQAEAAFTPTSRFTVDELEDLIRSERGLEPIHRGGDAVEVRHGDGT